MITAYKDHPLSELLPLMEDSEIEELATDIRQNTQRAPITLYEGKILDGRNRYRACKLANVEPKVRHFTTGNAVAFITSVNVFRRHLTVSQRALFAAKLANLSNGQTKSSSATLPSSPVTQSEAAREAHVSERTVRTARTVLQKAPKREIKKIETGEKTVATVARETKEKSEAKEKHFDTVGYPIPETVQPEWNIAESFRDTLGQLHKIKLRIQKAVDDSDLAFREITNSTVADLENVWRDLQRVLPYAVCPTCQGRLRANCVLCKQRGFISKFGYEHWVPKKTREIREKAIQK
jgi:hypothetical protein